MEVKERLALIADALKKRAGAELLPLERPFDTQLDLVLRLPKDKAGWSVLCYSLLRFQEQTRSQHPWLTLRAFHSEYRLKEGKLVIAGILSLQVDSVERLPDAVQVLHTWVSQTPTARRPPLTRVDLNVDMRVFSVNEEGKGIRRGTNHHPGPQIEAMRARR